jgi:hypothetical protein
MTNKLNTLKYKTGYQPTTTNRVSPNPPKKLCVVSLAS